MRVRWATRGHRIRCERCCSVRINWQIWEEMTADKFTFVILIYLLYLITKYLVKRRHVASWLLHWVHRHLTQHRPSTSEVLFAVPACGIDSIRHYKWTGRNITFLICCTLRNTIQCKCSTSAAKILRSDSQKFLQTHLSAFLCSDVFLQRDHIWDGLDGHQVDTWKEGGNKRTK